MSRRSFSRIANVTLPLWVVTAIAIALAASATPAAAASFLNSDALTEGNWHGTYGTDGYSVANDSQNIPAYATFAVQNQQNWTWAFPTTDPRALQTGSNTSRIAATWFNGASFNFDVNLTDGHSHQVAVYALDWDFQGRS